VKHIVIVRMGNLENPGKDAGGDPGE
jgi:hypothetical protein